MIQNKYDLFEFVQQKIPKGLDISGFIKFLDDVWVMYKTEKGLFWREENNNESKKLKQPFFRFDGDTFSSKGYVGFVKYNDIELNLYPKIFKDNNIDTENISDTLLLWLKYSHFRIPPSFKTGLDFCKGNIFEILIYLFAKYTTELFSTSLYQHYEIITEETSFLKGKINFSEYVKNTANGKAHKFNCSYDSFEFNNKFNQIVKYVSKMLLLLTNSLKNRNLLNEIVITLEEVDDIVCTASDCDSVYINRFMQDFLIILDYCKMFLSNSVVFNNKGNCCSFAFLIKTEQLFEDFISNCIKEHFSSGYNVLTQSFRYLDEDSKFTIKPDIIVKKDNEMVKIIDVKYKIDDILQSDIYQSISYGFKLGCEEITLIYPKTVENKNEQTITIKSGFDNRNMHINYKYVDSTSEEGLLSDLKRLSIVE